MPLTPIAIKEYIALLSQTGTNAPTATILKNTIGTMTWARQGIGSYYVTTPNGFPTDKCTCEPFDTKGDMNLPLGDTLPDSYFINTTFSNDNTKLILTITDSNYNNGTSELGPLLGNSKLLINIKIYT